VFVKLELLVSGNEFSQIISSSPLDPHRLDLSLLQEACRDVLLQSHKSLSFSGVEGWSTFCWKFFCVSKG
jgi:hypothetical protein